jgi:hypothetical protein
MRRWFRNHERKLMKAHVSDDLQPLFAFWGSFFFWTFLPGFLFVTSIHLFAQSTFSLIAVLVFLPWLITGLAIVIWNTRWTVSLFYSGWFLGDFFGPSEWTLKDMRKRLEYLESLDV